jgi:hypothetical protein
MLWAAALCQDRLQHRHFLVPASLPPKIWIGSEIEGGAARRLRQRAPSVGHRHWVPWLQGGGTGEGLGESVLLPTPLWDVPQGGDSRLPCGRGDEGLAEMLGIVPALRGLK